jgi:hypothetical protein
MLRSSNSTAQVRKAQVIVRTVLGVLLAANLIAAALILFPPGGSAEDLEQQLASLRAQVKTNQALLETTRQHASAVEKGRAEGDGFLNRYFLASRTASSTLLTELQAAANQSKIKEREQAHDIEPVEGSDSLSMMTITAAYEGTYANLVHFLHEIDQAPGLLIIDSLSAAPQQGTGTLTVSLKLEAFIREGGQDVAAVSQLRPGGDGQ